MAEAILREIDRGGQIYFVHNRVQSMPAMVEFLEDLVPQVRFVTAHGQMPERQLEKVMLAFLEGEYDCLLSTMIIESGLDIPSVNTLIVDRADRLGLAQLYQLRGRVGRSSKQAYAYLFIPSRKALSRKSVRRLRAIEEHTDREVRHICYPWHVSGSTAERLAREGGFRSAYCGKVPDVPITLSGGDPHRIARISEDYLELLPGQGRRALTGVLKAKWSRRFGGGR